MSTSWTETVGRRTFLKVLSGAGPAVAVAACSPLPPESIIPYVVPPEDAIPGVATWYASVCGECPAGCGIIVRTREGRAVKVEGNPEHPVNRGSLCVRGQASLQGLYNPDRFEGPRQRRVTNETAGQSVLDPIEWESAQQTLVDRIQTLRDAGRGDRIAVVTPLLSGALDTVIDRWSAAVGARRLRFEPFAYEAIRAANTLTFGRAAIPRYDLASPDLVVSFGADFLETWLSTVEHSRDHTDARRVTDGRKARFVQFEPRMSLTGASAGELIQIPPGAEGSIAAAMTHVIISEARHQVEGVSDDELDRLFAVVGDHAPEQVAEETGLPLDTIRELARSFSDPSAGPGRTLAIGGGVASSGPDATPTAVAINLLNYVAGNVGTTVMFGPDTTWGRADSYADLLALADQMRSGAIELVILHDVNPVHALPASADFVGALDAVPFVVATSSFPDETSTRADLVLPAHTPLESWGDNVARTGVRGLMQPTMQPLFDTRHLGDIFIEVGRALDDEVAALMPRSFFRFLRDEWETLMPANGPDAGEDAPVPDFELFWGAAVERGGLFQDIETETVVLAAELFDSELQLSPTTGERAFDLVVYPSINHYDGRGANRPWLQEIPDPLMKTTWGSWAEMTPETAVVVGATEGQLVSLESDHGAIDVTALINPHMRNGVIAVPMGQGHTAFGRYATDRGVNPAILLDPAPESASGGVRWLGTRVDATPRDVFRPVARAQYEFDQHDREIAQAVSLTSLVAGEVEPEAHYFTLNPEHEHPNHRWGMAIDLDSCNGCNACVAACYAENNIPVMGAEAMLRGRTMSWLRIERFVETEGPRNDQRFLPMLCQHCDHAPCETVCPVFATYHTDEGLNAQVYNRCVGTRYCANNCPYKVRRFNWFEPPFEAPLNLQLNPDVTGRTAGVMEKCTFCVQRIRDGQDRAKDEERDVADGDITSACAQTCPAQAIVFGDLTDPNSRVSRLSEENRGYHVLGELNTRPAVTYLKKVTEA